MMKVVTQAETKPETFQVTSENNPPVQEEKEKTEAIQKPSLMTPEMGKWLSETLKGRKSAGT